MKEKMGSNTHFLRAHLVEVSLAIRQLQGRVTSEQWLYGKRDLFILQCILAN